MGLPIKNQSLEETFYRQFNLTEQLLKDVDLTWLELKRIHDDYVETRPDLELAGTLITNTLMKVRKVHSVRFRTKEPLHLLEKIYRKRKEDTGRVITLENYKLEITDLIGVRAIHLFKTEWKILDREIKGKWNLHENPIAYYRQGDEISQIESYAKAGLTAKIHKYNYRSLHYVVQSTPAKATFLAEIQVRTIFEEGWSEIDHRIRYPYHTENKIYNEYLSILNRFAGGADEMGTFIKNLDLYLDEQEDIINDEKLLQQKKLTELIKKINSTTIAPEKKKEIIDEVEKLLPLKNPIKEAKSFQEIFTNLITTFDSFYVPGSTLPPIKK